MESKDKTRIRIVNDFYFVLYFLKPKANQTSDFIGYSSNLMKFEKSKKTTTNILQASSMSGECLKIAFFHVAGSSVSEIDVCNHLNEVHHSIKNSHENVEIT